MGFLPQEIVLAIVHQIDDIPSLKACALTGSMFRDASQRVLLRSLTLKGNMRAIHTLLVESPHFATYIRRLSIVFSFPGDRAPADIKTLQQNIQKIIVKLTNVHQCILDLNFLDQTPAFTLALFDFLASQPLRELNVRRPSGASILRLLTTAPVVSFFGVKLDIEGDLDPMFSLDNPQYTPRVEDLFVCYSAPKVYQLLAHPQLKSLTSTLRRLSILEYGSAWRSVLPQFISAAPPTLEHLYLGGLTGPIIQPAFPSLRSIEFCLQFNSNWTDWFPDFISSVVRTSPLLADIVISFFPNISYSLTPDAALGVLDVALTEHPSSQLFDGGLTWDLTPTRACRRHTRKSALCSRGMHMV
ncbi:hypothetical protein B0H12DRAFT_733788 [Mycena haematopus]|nr:hypothetical protein B0H12DRAFT_733788 [Mycena haematopus]